MPDATPSPPKPEAKVKIDVVSEIKLPSSALAIDVSADEKHLYAACFDGGVYEVAVDSGRYEALSRHDSYASGVSVLRARGEVISAGYDGVLIWHDLKTRREVRRLPAHRFWSRQLAVSPDESLVASVTGQYRAGGYQYEPAPEEEPSVRVYEAATGVLRQSWSHVPPVLSVKFSPDGRHLAAANMMGEVRIWEISSGKLVTNWTTPDFTCWGITKSHHYVGGIFAMEFTPDGDEVLVCGMGPMRDPMAANGKQRWQRFAWRASPPKKTGEINDDERGNGLMETLQFHPSGRYFLMAGKLQQGTWNTALFEAGSGRLLHSLDLKMRVTDAAFTRDGRQLFLSGALKQENKSGGKCPDFGRIKVLQCDHG